MRLDGKNALVTGASRGLGRWIAVALAEAGANVIVNYANSVQDAETTVRLIEERGGRAYAVKGSVIEEEAVKAIVRESERLLGGTLDILVNNATGPQPMVSIDESTWELYMDQLVFFVKAPLLLLKAVLPGMRAKGAGSVINIGSEVVQIGNAEFSSYVAAKSAMIGMTRSWASELGPDGIRVNLVAPGWIPVERHADSGEESFKSYSSQIPLRKMGEPNDIAAAVLYLASDGAKYVTGQCLSVNGGNTYGI